MSEGRKSFVRVHEIIATISNSIQNVEQMRVRIEYPSAEQGEILGEAKCNQEQYPALQQIFYSPIDSLRFESIDQLTGRKIHSSKFRISSLGNKIYGPTITEPHCTLKFHEFIIEHSVKAEPIDRQIVFFLTGPTEAWSVNEIVEPSFSGDVKHTLNEPVLDLGIEFPFSIEVRPWYFYDNDVELNLKKRGFALCYKIDRNHLSISNEDFFKRAEETTEDLLFLISFLSRAWIAWYKYDFIQGDKIIEKVKGDDRKYIKKREHHDLLLEKSRTRGFLKLAFPTLQSLRSKGIDLKIPLIHYISGYEARFIEERFTSLFLSLERIKDLYVKFNNTDKILSETHFKVLNKKICKLINESKHEIGANDGVTRQKIYSKIRELNRPTLQMVLFDLFSSYGVDWKDIYPADSKFTLTNTRDILFHSSVQMDPENLFKELTRLELLLDRLLIRMLGWTEVIKSDRPYSRRWLTEEAGE